MGGSSRTEMSVRVAPDACPRVTSLDYPHRSPVFMIAADGRAWVHVDLDGAPMAEARRFAALLGQAAEEYARQLDEWEQRARPDRTAAYPIPPLVYGSPGGADGAGDDSGASSS